MHLGIDPRKFASVRFYAKYRMQKSEWRRQGGQVDKSYPILSDYIQSAGSIGGHYFHQDLLVAQHIFKTNPRRHVDIGSRIDGFVAHIASFRKIEVADIRPIPENVHDNLEFRRVDFMSTSDLGEADSVSCLHAIEHFGLGRYSDPIDINGHNKGIHNLVNLVAPGGHLYLSFPIGQADEVHFNAHRIFHPTSILKHPAIKKEMKLTSFHYVDDAGMLHKNQGVEAVDYKVRYGCGIYIFQKIYTQPSGVSN